jgi:hypothetical protein
MALILTAEHFERAREAIRQRRADLEAAHAAELQKLDGELSEIDRLEEAARALAEKYAEPPERPDLPVPGNVLANGASASEPLLTPSVPVVPLSPRTFSSDKSMVLAALEELDSNGQGATRYDIYRHIANVYKRSVPENSITTYLNRLKQDNQAKFDGQKWHAEL